MHLRFRFRFENQIQILGQIVLVCWQTNKYILVWATWFVSKHLRQFQESRSGSHFGREEALVCVPHKHRISFFSLSIWTKSSQ